VRGSATGGVSCLYTSTMKPTCQGDISDSYTQCYVRAFLALSQYGFLHLGHTRGFSFLLVARRPLVPTPLASVALHHYLSHEASITSRGKWYMTHRIRKAMINHQLGVKLSGIIEIDDAVVKSDKGTPWGGGSYVLGMASREGYIKLQVLNKLKGEEVRRVVAENVEYVKAFYTHGHKLYRKMHGLDPHQFVVHQKAWVDGEVHVSYVENAWSLFKRGLIGIFHHVSTKYLQDYLDEFCFRYRHRHEKPRLMDLVLASC